MASEFDLQVAAQYRQSELLAEASAHRRIRTTDDRRDDPAPTGRRLQALLRRLAGAASYA